MMILRLWHITGIKMKKVIVDALVLLAMSGMLAGSAGCGVKKAGSAGLDKSLHNVTVVDFSEKSGIPLLKRQNTFSPSHSFTSGYAAEFVRDSHLLKDLASENMRIDLFMGNGGIGSEIGQGSPEDIKNSFAFPDMVFRMLYKNGTAPYISYFATPSALFDKSRGVINLWKYPPSDYKAWQQVCYDIAKHYMDLGWPLAANEIWNEPDFFDRSTNAMAFYEGTWDEYLQIYQYAVTGIRQANPDATVGGMSLANILTNVQNGNVDKFLSFVTGNHLPLDFISYHSYGSANYPSYTEAAIRAVSKYGKDLETVGLHLNEFHVRFNKPFGYDVVPLMFSAMEYFLAHPQITSVNWACFREVSEGLNYIDSRSGKRYAPFYALMIYNNMPVDRVKMDTKDYVSGFASIDSQKAGVLLYNQDNSGKDVEVSLDNLPFKTVNMKVYAIDASHSDYYTNGGSDELSCIYTANRIKTNDLLYHAKLASLGTCYIEITNADTQSKGNDGAVYTIDGDGNVISGGVATVLKKEYDFKDRAENTFSEFDLKAFTAYAGMGDSNTGTALGAVVLTNLPAKLHIDMEAWGKLKPQSGHAALFLRADYRGSGGEVLKSVVYQTKEFQSLPDIPWSAGAYSVADVSLNKPFTMQIAKDAPKGFSGVMELTYGIADCGSDTTLKVSIQKET